jgi:hypothetical protein
MNKIRLLLLWLLFFLPSAQVKAQSYSWDEFMEQYLNADENNEEQINTLYEELTEIHEHPFNINDITREELEQLPFMSADEVEELLAYLYSYGPIKSYGELDLVPKLEYDTRQFLRLFVYIGDAPAKRAVWSWSDAIRKGRQEILSRTEIPLYTRAGYRDYPDSTLARNPNRKYLGNAAYVSLRYQFAYANKLFFGVSAEKDAGEPFGTKGNSKGFDAYSFHLLVKDRGKLSRLALGDYKLTFGEGLVVNNDFQLGVTSLLSPVNKLKGIKRHASASESAYFRGAAATISLGHFDLTAFTSYRSLDATRSADSLGVSTIVDDGYHRTPLEMSKKGVLGSFIAGGDVTYSQGRFSGGVTALYSHFNHSFRQGTLLYRRFAPEGSHFTNVSVNYAYRDHQFYLHGETALDDNFKVATLNTLQWRLSSTYELLCMQRFYSYRYNALFSNAQSESGDTKNESGVFIGMNIRLKHHVRLSVYGDIFYHPWVTSFASRSSRGHVFFFQADYQPNRRTMFLFRYRLKARQQNYTDTLSDAQSLVYRNQHLARLQLNLQPSRRVFLRTELDGSLSHNSGSGKNSRGVLLAQSITCTSRTQNLQATLNASLFFTDDYDSRLYAYERGLLYTFSFPSYFYHGERTALTLRAAAGSHWLFLIKYGFTIYFNQHEIGSGPQLISTNYKNDVALQLRYKF